jgi:hypothetical protein
LNHWGVREVLKFLSIRHVKQLRGLVTVSRKKVDVHVFAEFILHALLALLIFVIEVVLQDQVKY